MFCHLCLDRERRMLWKQCVCKPSLSLAWLFTLTSAAWRQHGISSRAALSPISSSGVWLHVITINKNVILLYKQWKHPRAAEAEGGREKRLLEKSCLSPISPKHYSLLFHCLPDIFHFYLKWVFFYCVLTLLFSSLLNIICFILQVD